MPTSSGRVFKWWHILIGLLAAFIVAVVILFAGVFASTGPAVDATEDFFARLATDESLEDIYYSATASLLQEVTPLEDFEYLISVNPFMEEIISMYFDSREINTIDDYTYTTLMGELYTEEAYYPVMIELVQEDEAWKINLIQFE